MAAFGSEKCLLLLLYVVCYYATKAELQSFSSSSQKSPKDVVFVILNQPNSFHYRRALALKTSLLEEADLKGIAISVFVLSEEYEEIPFWTYFPVTKTVMERKELGSWYVFVEEFSGVDLSKLVEFVNKENETQLLYFGRGLHDQVTTIIHHFDPVDPQSAFEYPDPRPGFILSQELLRRTASVWDEANFTINFAIDAPYEFSKFLSRNFGVKLRDEPRICVDEDPQCFLWSSTVLGCGDDEEKREISSAAAEEETIHFAVKTCKKFNEARLPVLRDTWLSKRYNYGLYSHQDDTSEGVTPLNVPNTERGHCGKTLRIIRRAAQLARVAWVVIVDDDTLLSVKRLRDLVGCYPPSAMIALGERYAYKTSSGGFDYLTGGAGMVLSKPLVNFLADRQVCDCPSEDAPDDMFLGACFHRHRIPVIHSSRFHQGRPDDYSPQLLRGSNPISFHKFWMVDPVKVYKTWLEDPGDGALPADGSAARTEL